MENNGKESRKKLTKHIQVRYFFIKDHIENGDLSLKNFLIGEISSDLFTKPLQGAIFRILRAMIQGIPESTRDVDMRCTTDMAKVTPQDCIG